MYASVHTDTKYSKKGDFKQNEDYQEEWRGGRVRPPENRACDYGRKPFRRREGRYASELCIADALESTTCSTMSTPATVESIQDKVILRIMMAGYYNLAREYITYRYEHELLRKGNSTDAKILAIVNVFRERR